MKEQREMYGMTGEVGRDGLLNPEQLLLLDQIQENAANTVFEKAQNLQAGDLYPTVAMATGIGKGRIIHKVIDKQLRQKPNSKILVIAGTKLELVKQTHASLAEHTRRDQALEGEYIESEESEELTDAEELSLNGGSLLYRTGKYKSDANVQISTIQTIQSEHQKGTLSPEEYDLVIVDEVHNAGTQKRYEALQQFDKVIGFTATPRRHTGQMKDPEDYGFSVVESLTLPEAQDKRLLPPLCGVQIDTKDLVAEIPTNSFGLIDFKKLEKLLKDSPDLRPYIAERIANIISSEGRQYKTVIAVNFVWEAQELAQLLKDKGIRVGVAVNKQAAKEIDSEEIPALDAIERYKLPSSDEKSVQVLISPYVASEGFDAPFTEVLVWASPTDSPLRYTQYTGRLARRANGKLFGVVVDCLYQTSQYNWSYNFGMWMKGNVKQLDNGLLWLGPETDIRAIKELSAIKALEQQVDVQSIVELQIEQISLDFAPDGWESALGLSKSLGNNRATIIRRANLYRTIHPEWFHLFKGQTRRQVEYYSPELIAYLKETKGLPEEGWENNLTIARSLKRGERTIKHFAEPYRTTHPEWFRNFEGTTREKVEYYSPELVTIILRAISERQDMPEGWMSYTPFAKSLGKDPKTIKKIADQYRSEHPEWFKKFRNAAGRMSEGYAPELQIFIKRKLDMDLSGTT